MSRIHSSSHEVFVWRTQSRAGKVGWQETLVQPIGHILGSLATKVPGSQSTPGVMQCTA